MLLPPGPTRGGRWLLLEVHRAPPCAAHGCPGALAPALPMCCCRLHVCTACYERRQYDGLRAVVSGRRPIRAAAACGGEGGVVLALPKPAGRLGQAAADPAHSIPCPQGSIRP